MSTGQPIAHGCAVWQLAAAHAPKSLLCVVALLLFAGCPTTGQNPNQREAAGEPASSAVPTRVLVVDDSHLADTIEREWRAHSEEALVVKRATREELLAKKRLGTDVLIFPTELLGELVESNRLARIPDVVLTDASLDRATLFPRLRDDLGTWGRNTYGQPLGAPTFQLLYRSDIFEKLGLGVPRTWAEYNDLLPKLADRTAIAELAPAEDTAWVPSAEPLAPGWAAKVLLARAAAYAADGQTNSPFVDINSLEPRTASPAYIKALEELVTAAKERPSWLELTPATARAELLAGRAAMAITWPSGVRTEEARPPSMAPPIRVASLPGSADYYSLATENWQPREGGAAVSFVGAEGCLAAVTQDCRRPSVALHFVSWLTNSDASDRISSQAIAGSPTRKSQASRAALWVDPELAEGLGGGYFSLLQDDLSRTVFLPPLRLPAGAKMMAVLDRAVLAAISGERAPEAALQQAAQQWKDIQAELDPEEVRASVRRGLNLSQ